MAAAEDCNEEETEQILYDLLVHAEWQLEAEPLGKSEEEFWRQKGPLHWKLWKLTQSTVEYVIEAATNSIRNKTSFGCPPGTFADTVSNNLPWNLSLSSNGKVLAVLKDDVIEIRSFKDSYNSVIAKCKIDTDPFPQWRRISWNESGSMLAYSSSVGDIFVFDPTGSLLYAIKQPGPKMNLPTGFSHSLCSLFFMDAPKSSEWDGVLIAVTYQGAMQKFLLSNSAFRLEHTFSFVRFHPSGVAAVTYSTKHGVFIVVGFRGDEPTLDKEDFSGGDAGITLWRELSDIPFYTMIDKNTKYSKQATGKEKFKELVQVPWQKRDNTHHSVYKCSLSPCEDTFITLHQNGRIALWRLPSLKLEKTWSFSEQPSSDISSGEFMFQDTGQSERGINSQRKFVNINWWSEKAIICARGSGAIVVSNTDKSTANHDPLRPPDPLLLSYDLKVACGVGSVFFLCVVPESLQNLLGHSEEMFEPWPCTTDATNGQFIVLECEKKVKTPGENIQPKETEFELVGGHDDDDNENFMNRISKICKQALFFLTEHDNFKLPPKKIRFAQRIYRLIALQSTTPEELYARKIDLEEYGEALDLARRFKLDTDLVYQRQWKRSPITVITIKDYLTKIHDRFWVLNECVQRVPEDIDAMKHLLEYGLIGTSIQVMDVIDSKDKLPFLIKDDTDEDSDDDQIDKKKKVKRLSDVMDVKSLTANQIQLCKYRWQILQYLDRLETYEIILGGPFRAVERYKPDFFLQFRCCDIVDQAFEYARTSNSEPLEELFTFHGKDVLPHWLAILSNFPETTPISSYKRLLPMISQDKSADSKLKEWKQSQHRDPDWVEEPSIIRHVIQSTDDSDQASFIYADQAYLEEFRSCRDEKLVTKWFIRRAHEIEDRANLVDNALSLIEHGKDNGIQGLNELHDTLKWLGTLVYEVNIEPAIGLAEFEKLSNLAKLRLLLSKSSEESFLQDYLKFGKRFIEFIGKVKPEEQWKLLHLYLTDVAKANLTFPFKIFEKSIPGSKEPLIPDVANLMRLAMDCIYICKRDDQLDVAFKIVECLPTREDDHLSDQIDDLHDKVDQMEQLLRGAEIMEFYTMPKPVSFLVDHKGDTNVAREIFNSMSRNSAKRQPPLKSNEWNVLLKHVQQLKEDVFGCISVSELYQIFVKYLLSSGVEENLYLAKELLNCTASKRKIKDEALSTPEKKVRKPSPRLTNASFVIPYDESINLVLEAEKEYFNAGANLMDASMDLARKCLGLIEDSPPAVQHELDLISALSILSEFEVNILPVQVRLYEDKLDLVKLAVTSSSDGYQKTAKIHKLARLLKVCGSDEKERIGKVTTLLADTAIQKEDFAFAKELCLSLIDSNYGPAWSVCRTLCETEKFSDLDAKQNLLAFAVTFCHPDELELLLITRNLIETQVIYRELSKQGETDDDNDDDDDDDDHAVANDIAQTFYEQEESIDSIDGQGSSSLLGRTQKQLTSKTKSIISSVSDKKWWKSQVIWVGHLNKSTSSRNARKQSHEDQCRICYHPFYATQGQAGQSEPNQEFEGIFGAVEEGSDLMVNTLLLRSQKLCESRAEGTISEPSNEVILQLAEGELYHETIMFLAYILSLTKMEDADELFDKYHGDPLLLQMAAYLLSLQLQRNRNQETKNEVCELYLTEPLHVIRHVLQSSDKTATAPETELPESNDKLMKSLRKYLLVLADFVQAKTLEDLGKGVDVKRFMEDNEYKRETVLGLAMNLEEELLNTALTLADKYDVPSWEVICAHVEFLLTDSGLKVKEIQERLTKLDAAATLRANAEEFIVKMRTYVYPYISGKDHALLLALFTLVQQCCGDDAVLEGSLDMASHCRNLKKIKAAAPGMDYKELIHGNKPLEAVESVLMESNVHLLAKLVPKINGPNKQERVTAGQIFSAFARKSFWQPDKKQDESQAQWIHRFEACQKFFNKLSAEDVVAFTDDVTFSENAIDKLSEDIRMQIINRVMKYARQQKAQEEKQGNIKEDSERETYSFADAEVHLEQSRLHIQSLKHDLFVNWSVSEDENERNYARRFDLSRSNTSKVCEQARDLFLDLRKPEEIAEVFKMANQEKKYKSLVADSFRAALSVVIEDIKLKRVEMNIERLSDMVTMVNEHIQDGGILISQEDVLVVIRPLCADLEVKTDLKMELLTLLEKSFELSGEDIFLLIYYQTEAIISSVWGKQVTFEEIDSDKKRQEMFSVLLEDSENVTQLRAIGQLLLVWPVLAAVELSEDTPETNPWIMLLNKLIEFRDIQQSLEFIRKASKTCVFSYQSYLLLYEKLMKDNFKRDALKMALISEDETCIQRAYQDLQDSNIDTTCNDEDLFSLVLETKTVDKITMTTLYNSFVDYILTKSQNESIFDDVVSQLKSAGLFAEAGTLILRQRSLHEGLSTIDNAVMTFKAWFKR